VAVLLSGRRVCGVLTGIGDQKSPSANVNELDNRGSHFYMAMYWAEAMASQRDDAELRARFAPLARTLAEDEATIVSELNAVEGKPVDVGGYYAPNPELAARAMRLSTTFNRALASF
jgi:isocitrate dehydrogenase